MNTPNEIMTSAVSYIRIYFLSLISVITYNMGIGVTVVMSTLLLVFGRQAFGLFNQDPKVIDYGIRIIWTTFPFYWIYVILEENG